MNFYLLLLLLSLAIACLALAKYLRAGVMFMAVSSIFFLFVGMSLWQTGFETPYASLDNESVFTSNNYSNLTYVYNATYCNMNGTLGGGVPLGIGLSSGWYSPSTGACAGNTTNASISSQYLTSSNPYVSSSWKNTTRTGSVAFVAQRDVYTEALGILFVIIALAIGYFAAEGLNPQRKPD